jgi:hypothetical protein
VIVRELLAVFGLDYDSRGERAAQKGILNVRKSVEGLQTAVSKIFGAALVAAPFIGLAKLASDAQENLNLLEVMFKGSAQDVVEWSNTAGKALGRSRYTMRQLAAELGGLVGAMLGPGEEAAAKAAEMSTNLAEVAVNLSSLRNISEDRALTVLQSALAGETEAIKRFGPQLTVAAHEAEILRMGLGKTYKELTAAEKVQVRYNILMRDLAFTQGDAANTIDQFANSWRAFRDNLKDIATEIGLFLLPGFEDLLSTARAFTDPIARGARAFRAWTKDTNLARGALIALGLIMTAMVLPSLISMLPFIAAFGLLALVIDDVLTFIKGGDSVIGHFVNYVRDLWGSMLDWLSTAWEEFTWDGLWNAIVERGAGAMDWIAEKWGGLVDWLLAKWGEFQIDWTPQINAIKTFLANVADRVAAFLDTKIGKILFALAGAYVGKKLGGMAGSASGEALGSLLGKTRIPGSKAVGGFLGDKLGGLLGAGTGIISGLASGGVAAGGAADVLRAGSASLRGGAAVQQSNSVEISVTQQPGQSGTDLAQQIGAEVKKELESRDLDLLSELLPQAAASE